MRTNLQHQSTNLSKQNALPLVVHERQALVRDYLATLTNEKQQLAYEESKVGSAGVQEIYTDIASQYKAKLRISGGGGALPQKAVYFEPIGDLTKAKQSAPVVKPSSFKTFNDHFDPEPN